MSAQPQIKEPRLTIEGAILMALDEMEASGKHVSAVVDEIGLLYRLEEDAYERMARLGLIKRVQDELHSQRSHLSRRRTPDELEEDVKDQTRALRVAIDPFLTRYRRADGKTQAMLYDFVYEDAQALNTRAKNTMTYAKDWQRFTGEMEKSLAARPLQPLRNQPPAVLERLRDLLEAQKQ